MMFTHQQVVMLHSIVFTDNTRHVQNMLLRMDYQLDII